MGLLDRLFGKKDKVAFGPVLPGSEREPEEEARAHQAPGGPESLLKWKTRDDVSPEGRTKVFFCAYPADTESGLKALAEDLFSDSKYSPVLFFLSDPSAKLTLEKTKSLLEALDDMKLLMIPVTSDFLYLPNPAREVVLPYALEKKIPILPVIMEKGLEPEFSRLCGELHCLNRVDNDPTQLPYREKLEKFFAAVMENDDLTEKIRSAFDAYIFLSYRKKDREHAKEIMKQIHRNDFCRDVAIWFDEYLFPGEDFNNNIRKALEHSKLFAMVITPSLLEKPNYVMEEEYPRARAGGKKILGIEAVRTDREQLKKDYAGLSLIADASDFEDLRSRIRALLEAGDTENQAPEHLYLIGLAYLGGIDTEKDPLKALDLIREAAKQDLPAAARKLASMYRYGEGVGRDPEEALFWLEELFRMLEEDLSEGECAFGELFEAGTDLIDACLEQFRYDDAAAVWDEMLPKVRDTTDLEMTVKQYDRGVKILNGRGEPEEAARLCITALKKLKQFPESPVRSADEALFYGKIGDIMMASRVFDEAADYYRMGLDALKDGEDPASRRTRAVLLGKTAEATEKGTGDFKRSSEIMEEGLTLMEAIVRQTGEEKDRLALADAFQAAEDLLRRGLRMKEAEEYAQKACGLYRERADRTGAPGDLAEYALSLKRLAWYHDSASMEARAEAIWRELAARYPGVERFSAMVRLAEEKKALKVF